jgi:hypothetical protein
LEADEARVCIAGASARREVLLVRTPGGLAVVFMNGEVVTTAGVQQSVLNPLAIRTGHFCGYAYPALPFGVAASFPQAEDFFFFSFFFFFLMERFQPF